MRIADFRGQNYERFETWNKQAIPLENIQSISKVYGPKHRPMFDVIFKNGPVSQESFHSSDRAGLISALNKYRKKIKELEKWRLNFIKRSTKD